MENARFTKYFELTNLGLIDDNFRFPPFSFFAFLALFPFFLKLGKRKIHLWTFQIRATDNITDGDFPLDVFLLVDCVSIICKQK